MTDLKDTIEAAWLDRSLLQGWETKKAIRDTIELLDLGKVRVAEPLPAEANGEGRDGNGGWITHEWIKKAISLYFPIQEMQTIEVGPFEYTIKSRSSLVLRQKGFG